MMEGEDGDQQMLGNKDNHRLGQSSVFNDIMMEEENVLL